MSVLKVKDSNGQWVSVTAVNQIDYEYVIEPLEIDANGTYTAPAHIDGYSPIVVNVPIPEPEVKEPVIEPITIVENGTYESPTGVDGYSPITVNIPIPEIPEPVIEELTITENGTYEVPADVDGFGPVIVNVPTGGGDIPEVVLSGNCQNACSSAVWNGFYDYVVTENISDATRMFENNTIEFIPFDINLRTDTRDTSCTSMFYNCKNLKSTPRINGNVGVTKEMFYYCNNLREILDDGANSSTRANSMDSSKSMYRMFYSCYSLRELPMNIIGTVYPWADTYACLYYWGFYDCYALNKISNLPIHHKANYTSNAFGNMVSGCYRINELTFASQEDGSPYQVNWKNQTINLSSTFGWTNNKISLLNYNSGITADKEVTDDTTYVALKDDPDWFTCNVAYSRYNHDSARATINSLPDTSAYLATSGGTNTIKFKGAAGSATDGGAINTLTEAEIAVAMAKGWTVSLV
jgi:hypothetical protein